MAMFAAILRASSLLSSLAAERRAGSVTPRKGRAHTSDKVDGFFP
jgi:hypothetical protein